MYSVASVSSAVNSCSHQERCLSVPASARCIRSPSLAMPTSLPWSSTTGAALIRRSRKIFAASFTEDEDFTVITGETITSRAFIVDSSSFYEVRKLLQSELSLIQIKSGRASQSSLHYVAAIALALGLSDGLSR